MPILLIILLLILAEIALFVLVGQRIGLWPVLALTLLSILLGVGVLRWQGSRAAALARGGLGNVSPGTFMAKGAFAVLAGLLLLLPGFLTDLAGLLLLVPPLQRLLVRALAARLGPQHRQGPHQEAEIIEGSFRVDDDAGPPPHEHDTQPRRRLDAPQAPRGHSRPDNSRQDPGQGRNRGH